MKLLTILCTLLVLNLYPQDTEDDKLDSLKTYDVPNLTVTSNRAEFGVSPVSFSEMDEKQIELRTSAVDLPQIINNQPSIYTYSENGNHIGYSNIRLRGFDQRRISVYINGVPQNDPEIHNVFWLNLNDIQESVGEIQIQRGAGMSNYGAPAIAGSINLTTSNFINNPGVRFSLGAGFQEFGHPNRRSDSENILGINEIQSNASKMKFEYSSGLVGGKYAFYGKLARINSGGYRENSWVQSNSWFLSAVRFDENLTTQVNIFGGNQVDGLAYNGIPKADIENLNLRTANYLSRDETEQFSSPQFQILNDWTINDNLSLKSTLFYFEGRGHFDYPGGPFQSSFFNLTDTDNDIFMNNTIIRGYVGNRQGGWIPRLVWKHNQGELTTGAEIRIHQSEHNGTFQYADQFPAGFDRNFQIFEYISGKNVFSLFAREKYNLTDKLMINLEGQLVYNNYYLRDEEFAGEFKSYQTTNGEVSGGTLFDLDYLFFNPRLGANYKLNEKVSLYSSIAYTSREPRRNAIYNADFAFYGIRPLFSIDSTGGNEIYDFDDPLITPERMLNIEIGANYNSEYVEGGLNFYVMNYTDELVASGAIDFYGAPIESNAPATSHYGVELFGRHNWVIDNHKIGFDLNLNYSINEIIEMENFRAIDLDGDFVTDTLLTFDLEGNTIAGNPDFLLNVGADYNFGGFTLRLDGKYVSEMYLNNLSEDQQSSLNNFLTDNGLALTVPDNIIDSYFVMDLNMSYQFNDLLGAQYILLKAQVNNLTNELYAPFANESGFFVAAERNFWLTVELGI